MHNKTYVVDLGAVSDVSARVRVEAKDDDEAKEKALSLAYSGEALWRMNGISDASPIVAIVATEQFSS